MRNEMPPGTFIVPGGAKQERAESGTSNPIAAFNSQFAVNPAVV